MVTNVAVGPGVEVDASTRDGDRALARIVIEGIGVDAECSLDDPLGATDPFVAMAVAVANPAGSLEIRVRSAVPPASGLGTSAAVSVAVIGAIWSLDQRSYTLPELAAAALSVENRLGLQSGVQDQLAAAFGGTHRFDVRYPSLGAAHRLADDPRALFENRLVTVYLGRPHSSSAIHEQVIAELEAGGHRSALDDIRVAAMNAGASILRADIRGFGRAMTQHNDATRRLHSTIVSAEADAVGELAMDHGASGWKANGAGGSGGTVAIVASQDPDERASFTDALAASGLGVVLAVHPVAHGFVVTASDELAR